MLQLRDYQERSLDALAGYFEQAAQQGAKVPFVLATGLPYREVAQLPAMPYICLRVPTGGGKTFMACHAVGIAADKYLHADYPTILWLAPSNTIVDQTLAALKNRQHPYRQELDQRFGGNVEVLSLKDALYLQRAVLDGAATIIVSTIQAWRVDDTEGRKVYETNGQLSHHFSGLSADQEARLEKADDGTFPHSLANVLRLRRPVVVMDEAHNARRPLSFDTLARFTPSAVIEFTATPETTHKPERGLFASNVLHQVSARELKSAEMIKMPIRLRAELSDWKEAVAAAVEQQRELERLAIEEEKCGAAHLRPIVLLQAQSSNQDLTVETIKQCLVEDCKIPECQIAIATGTQREIDGVNLLDRDCEIRFIITMRALGEGWDCPFAYVLCSVAELGSARAVEQILGRVLRLPGAKRRQHEELNRAYAFVASQRFFEAANSLQGALIENGFQPMEAADFVQPHEQREISFDPNSLFASATEPVTEQPKLTDLPGDLQRRVSYDGQAGTLTVTQAMSLPEMETLRERFAKPADKAAVETIYRRLGGRAAVPRPPFNVPKLAIRLDGQLDMFEDQFLDTPWNLAQCDASLSEAEFPSEHSAGRAGDIDITDDGQVEMVRFVEQVHDDLHRLIVEPAWTPAALANWLDRLIPHQDIPRAQSSLFMGNVLAGLMESRGVSVDQIAREKYRLARAIERKIDEHRSAHAKKEFERLLFGPDSPVEVDPSFCFAIVEEDYAPNWYYEGGFRFQKHYFAHVGELKSEGEEFECARFIDSMEEVEWWVRNLDRRADSSFWLQTSTDRFYPDFIALLKDGRYLAVESKGEHLWSNDDSKEKRQVGDLWADRSGGRCVFVMPRGSDWPAITSFSTRPPRAS